MANMENVTPESLKLADRYVNSMFSGEEAAILMKQENLETIADLVVQFLNDDPDRVENEMRRIVAEATGKSVPGAADGTDVFGAGAETKKATRRNVGTKVDHAPEYEKYRVIRNAANSLQASNYGAVAQIVSVRGATIGYVTPTPDHLDFVKSTKVDKTTGKVETTFAVKSCAPGAIKAYVLALPMFAMEEVNKFATDVNADPSVCDVARAQTEGQPFGIQFMTPERFNETFLSLQCAGSIAEAPQLFAPYVHRKMIPSTKTSTYTAYNNLADVEAGVAANEDIVAGKNAIYLKVSYRQDNNVPVPYVRSLHTLRNRLQAPGNFIPASIYETITLRDSYSHEEAKELNNIYFSRYNTAKFKSNVAILDTISDADKSVTIGVDESNQKSIIATRFFATNPSESLMTQAIPHWYDKKANGDAVTIVPAGKELIKKVRVVGKAGANGAPGKVSYKIAYKEMQATQNAEGTAYVPNFSDVNDPMFGKIAQACKAYGVTLNVEDLVKFLKDSSVLRGPKKTGGKSASKKRVPKPVGLAALGFARSKNSTALAEAIAQM